MDDASNGSTDDLPTVDEMAAAVRRFRADRRDLDASARAAAWSTVCTVCARRMRFDVELQELQVCDHVMEALRRRAETALDSPASIPFDSLCGIRVVRVPSDCLPSLLATLASWRFP